MTTRSILQLTVAGYAILAIAGCRPALNSSAAPAPQAEVPVLVHQSGQPEMMSLKLSTVPGATFSDVHEVELPGVLRRRGR